MATVGHRQDITRDVDRLSGLKLHTFDGVDYIHPTWEQMGDYACGNTYGLQHYLKAQLDKARNVGKLLGLAVDATYKTVCAEPKFAEPATWSRMNANGTIKKKAKK